MLGNRVVSTVARVSSLVLLAAGSLVPAGCGSSGGAPGGGGGGITSRNAAIRDALAAFGAIHGPTRDAENQSMLDWFHKNPEFVDSGITDGCAWAHCKDHTTVIMANNRQVNDDGTRAAQSAPTRLAIELPGPKASHVINNFGGGNAAVSNQITQMLQGHGYTVTGAGGSIASLGNLSGDGVFYIDSHGLSLTEDDGKDTYYLMTSDLYDSTNTTTHDAGLNSHFLSVLGEKHTVKQADGTFKEVLNGNYAISDRYATSNWGQFGKNSFVFINACSSAKTSLFRNICFAKGATAYAGWSGDVQNTFASRVAPFAFDRMLGANKTDPEADGPQRPFDYVKMQDDLKKHGLTQDTAGVALIITPKPGTDFGLLAPTISYMGVDEGKKELTVSGVFGTEQGKVTVGATEVTVKGWGFNSIVCDLQPGIAGDVIVEVRGHKSNVVQLTEWKARFNTRFETETGDGGSPFLQTGYLDVSFRADIHSHRDDPHEKPFDPIVPFLEEETSAGQFTASGSHFYPGDPGFTTTWSGTVDLIHYYAKGASQNTLTCFGGIDVKQKTIYFTLQGTSTTGMTSTDIPGTGPETIPGITGHLDGASELHLTLNDDFSINGGVREEVVGPLKFRMDWAKITPTSPPDPKAARSASVTVRGH